MDSRYALTLSALLTLFIATNIFFFTQIEDSELTTSKVTRVIDGDTLVIENNDTLRLANINTPEKNSPGYDEAKDFLSTLENATILFDSLGREKYGRILARVYFGEEYVNLKIVELGLANKFLVDDSEIKSFHEAELEAVSLGLGLWKTSEYQDCLSFQIFPEEEIVSLENICPNINFKNWRLKDESRKEYKFPPTSFTEINLHSRKGQDNETDIFWNSAQNIWNNDRDSAYLFDAENHLVIQKAYGY